MRCSLLFVMHGKTLRPPFFCDEISPMGESSDWPPSGTGFDSGSDLHRFGTSLGPVWDRFRTMFGHVGDGFGMVLQWSWYGFVIVLVWFWDCFGTVLGSCLSFGDN